MKNREKESVNYPKSPEEWFNLGFTLG